MPFPFTLPTTSSVPLQSYFESRTHPSLPLAATSKRSIVKDALKRHKRLPAHDQATHLLSVQNAILSYLPYLLALEAGTTSHSVAQQRIDVEPRKPFEVEWRTTISAVLPGREASRPKLTGLRCELAFSQSTLAYVYTLLARSHLRTIYEATDSSSETRTLAISSAMKYLLLAHGIYKHLSALQPTDQNANVPIDIQESTFSGLASLALAEATLAVIAKDDPYAAAVADDRNDKNIDWMYKAPTIPKPRASLYVRICLAAADHAAQAYGLLGRTSGGRVDEVLLKYVNDLKRTARAKAMRFSAVNAELTGKTGEALAWLNAAKRELGLTSEHEDGKRKGLRGIKQNWLERREDLKVEKGGEWGLDAGRLEEARVVEMLDAKWERENNTVNVQIVPPYEPLLQQLPSGREYHEPQSWSPPSLSLDELAAMRVQPDATEAFAGTEDDSGDDRVDSDVPVGAFPGSSSQYGHHEERSYF